VLAVVVAVVLVLDPLGNLVLNISGSATGARPVELTVVVQSEVRPWRFPRREIA
jgi:hypothetical protein